MSDEAFYIYSIVEGHGEKRAVQKLLHGIWSAFNYSVKLVTTEEPYFVPKSVFFKVDDSPRRKSALEWAGNCARQGAPDSGIIILMDADAVCPQDFLGSEQVADAFNDVEEIIGNIPHVFALAEKGYESWLVAGLGGGDGLTDPKQWLDEYVARSCNQPSYKKTRHQHVLTSKMDIRKAKEKNASFRRFVNKIELKFLPQASGGGK